MGSLGFTDWAIFFGYVVLVFALALRFAGQQQTNEDFFLGGRKMWWLPIGLSMFATILSSISFIGMPTQAAIGTYHVYLAVLLIPLLIVPVMGWFFVPFFHRLKVTSPYEYLELRFDRPLRLMGSLLFVAYSFPWMGNLLYASSHVMVPVLGLGPDDLGTIAWLLVGIGAFATLYTVLGGFKAVIWTDVLQGFVLGGGMLFILWTGLSLLDGGWSGLLEVGRDYDKFRMFDTHFDISPGSENVYTALSIALFTFLPWYAITLTAVQRYVSMPSIRAARHSLVVNGIMVGVVCLIFFLVGTMVFAFYHQDLPLGAKAGDGFPKVHANQLLPHFLVHEVAQVGLLGLLMAGLFAASMSSIDSGINALTASIVYDWMPGRQLKVAFSRLLSALFGTAAVISAVVILYQRLEVYDLVISLSGTVLGLLMAVFLLGMLVKRANSGGVWVGLAAGVTVLALTWNHVDGTWHGAMSCLPTFFAGWATSYFFPSPPIEKIRGLVVGA